MKKDFFDYITSIMATHGDIYLLLGDLGYPRYEELKIAYPNRVYNLGASEQTMLDTAVGLALSGKIPITYTITPFYYRGFETIRTYINHENLNVKMIGAGRGDDYGKHDGYSHDATDIKQVLSTLPNIIQHYPNKNEELDSILRGMIIFKGPEFFSLRR